MTACTCDAGRQFAADIAAQRARQMNAELPEATRDMLKLKGDDLMTRDTDLIRRGDAIKAVTDADRDCRGAHGARENIAALPAHPVQEPQDDETCTGCYGSGWDGNAERFCHCLDGISARKAQEAVQEPPSPGVTAGAHEFYSGNVDARVAEMTDVDVWQLCLDGDEFERKGRIGDCLLRREAEAWMDRLGFAHDHVALRMMDFVHAAHKRRSIQAATPAPVVPAEGLAAELSSTMSRYDAAALPDDENGMAAPVMLGPEYVRKIIAALRAGCGPSWEVLPLTWESFGLEMWADSVGGRYYISGHGGKWSWTFDDDDPYHHGETVASEEAAKSAANSHNSAHIATALRSAPPVGARVKPLAAVFDAAQAEAEKAMRKFPQPNYVISKVAEEAGEVVKAAIHCAENRETKEAVLGEVVQCMAMLIRLCLEGDQVHGLAALLPAGEGVE